MQSAVDAALAAIASAGDSSALKQVRTEHTGEKSALALLNAELRNVPNDQKAALGKLVGGARGRVNQAFAAREAEIVEAEAAAQLAAEAVDVTALPSRFTPGARHPLSLLQDRVCDVFTGNGLGDRRGTRGRERVVQLRCAELRRRSPGARHAGHVLRRPARGAPRDAHPHEPGADPFDARARAAALRARAGPRVPHRRVRRHAPAGLHAVRGRRRRQGPHDGAPQGHARPLREVDLRRRGEGPPAPELLPVHRAERRARLLAPHLQGRRALDRVGRLRHDAPERAEGRGHRSRGVHRVRIRHGGRARSHAPQDVQDMREMVEGDIRFSQQFGMVV